VDAGTIRKFLTEFLALSTAKSRPVWVHKRLGDRAAQLRFTEEISVDEIQKLISGELEFKNEKIKCDMRPESDDSQSKRQKVSETDNSNVSTIESIVLPLMSTPYEEQLTEKKRDVVHAMDAALEGVRKSAKSRGYTPVPSWDNLTVDNTISGLNEGYRNKCEFTFAKNESGIPDIGFVLRRATNNSEPVVVGGENLFHISPIIREIVSSIRPLLAELVPDYPLFSHITKSGCWRMMMIRACPITGESQVIIQSGPIEDENLRKIFESRTSEWATRNGQITSLFLQYNSGFTDSIALSHQNKMHHLTGPESIHMGIGNVVKLSVNPLSFFQTNSFGCHLLYSKVAELARVEYPTTIFDICCGVGSIGMFLAASGVSSDMQIVGVDIVAEAIENAKTNAANNGLSSERCKYICGRAESVMSQLTTMGTTNDGERQYVCIVDPPRVGLHKSVLSAIRECEKIETLIYVSCNPKSLSNDLVKLCEPHTSSPDEEGIAVNHRFVPQYAVAVDMFPHTPHCEVIVKLTRPKVP